MKPSLLTALFRPVLRALVFACLLGFAGIDLRAQSSGLDWAPSNGGNGLSLYQEANWIDPDTGKAPPAGAVDPNTDLNRSLFVRKGIPGGGSGAGADLRMGTGPLTVSHATLRMSANNQAGIFLGGGASTITITEGKVFTEFVNGGDVTLSGHSNLTLYGADPLTNSVIDLQSANCFVYFIDRLPTEISGAYLSHFTVNGAPAVLNTNVFIRQYYNGAVIRPTLPFNQALKAFDLPDLEGTRWNFTTGFKGKVGLGLTGYEAGTAKYTVDGWGDDISGTGDEFHFAYRTLTGDGEIVAKVDTVQNTDASAKAGVMIREDLTDGSRKAFIFRRPDKQVAFQWRTSPGGTTNNSGVTGGTAALKWVRLVRAGNTFTSYYSTTSATGPWTQAGTVAITMPSTVYFGLAATSRLGIERGTSTFTAVTVIEGAVPVGPPGALGIFDATADIEAAWNRDDRISSFLLKKGYMVTVAERGGGQGASKVYVATEADLRVNLPPELDNKISFMRILPWRWIAKKGWAGGNTGHMTTIGAFWNYEWEPTGASTLNREFVPMILGRGQDKDFRWEEVRVRGNQTHFLGFNEPESVNQGNLTVDEAIALWPKAQQLGLRLGSPARTDGANGDNWLMEFMTKAAMKGYRVDYICAHNYNRKTGAALQTWLDAEYAEYGLPIWLTEFQRETNDNPTAAQHQAYLEEVLPMLEGLSYLERYSYYQFNTANPPDGNAFLINGNGTPNARGQVYADVVSNPAYENTGQPKWCSVNLTSPPANTILITGTNTLLRATVSLGSSVVSQVEFFADNVSLGIDTTAPYTASLAGLPPGFHTLYATATTLFGESVTSTPRQVKVTPFGDVDPLPGPPGVIRWSAVPGETYRVEYCDDLVSWLPLVEFVADDLVEEIEDAAAPGEPRRFYRIIWLK